MEPDETRPTGGEDVARRGDWEKNHADIQRCFLETLDREKRVPTTAEVMAATGLKETAVKDHLRSLKNNPDRFARFRMLTEDVVMGMYRASRAGDARAGKLFLQFVEEWEEKKRITQVNQNPYAGLTDDDLRRKLAERISRMKNLVPDPAAPEPPAAG